MQLRTKKERLHSMRSITTRDCCSGSGTSTYRTPEEKIDDAPLLLRVSQDWNETHIRLFEQERAIEDHRRHKSVIFSVEHREIKEKGITPSFPAHAQIQKQQPNYSNNEIRYLDKNSHPFPRIDDSRFPSYSFLNSPSCNQHYTSNRIYKDGAWNQQLPFKNTNNTQHVRENQRTTIISAFESSSKQSTTFERRPTSFLLPNNFDQAKSFPHKHDNIDFRNSSKQCLPFPGQSAFQNYGYSAYEESEHREFCQIEVTDTEELLSREDKTSQSKCCSSFNCKLVFSVILITVIALIALGSTIYIGVTSSSSPTTVNVTTNSSARLQTKHSSMRQVDVCGVIPSQYKTRKTANHRPEGRKFSVTNLIPSRQIVNPEQNIRKSLSPRVQINGGKTLSTSLQQKTIILDRKRRVVGGIDVDPGVIPWQVGLFIESSFLLSLHCGGSIVMNRWILTAAHCTDEWKMPKSWVAYVGLTDWSKRNETSVQKRKVIKIHRHENYTGKPSYHNDVALFQVDREFTYTNLIQPICLPPQGFQLPADAACFVSGWGATRNPKNEYPKHLQGAQINIIAKNTCNEWLDGHVSSRVICAGEPEGGKDACGGDSGGPLSYYDRENKLWLLAGTVSWGQVCGKAREPGIYVKISDFTDWIWSKIASYSK